MSVSMQGGSSSAESKATTGDLSGATAGGFHGAFVNNFAARGARLDAAAAAGDPGLLGATGSPLLILGAAAGAAALYFALRRR